MSTDTTDTDPKPDPQPDPEPAGKPAGKVTKAAKKARQTTGPTRRSPGRPSNRDKRAEQVAGLYQTLAFSLDLAGNLGGSPALAADAAAINANAEALGQAWAEVAETNRTVARLLDQLSGGNAWGGLALAHVPLALAIMGNHAPRPEPLHAVPDPAPFPDQTVPTP